MCPTPPAPAWINTFWPATHLARSTMPSQAVMVISGRAEASRMESDFGLRAIRSVFADDELGQRTLHPRQRRPPCHRPRRRAKGRDPWADLFHYTAMSRPRTAGRACWHDRLPGMYLGVQRIHATGVNAQQNLTC